jgi:hypothetical protein
VTDTDIIWSDIGYLSDNVLVGYHKIFLFDHEIHKFIKYSSFTQKLQISYKNQ